MLAKSPFAYFFYLCLIIFLFSCSAERKNILSKTYHNTTARYNAYYYAKKRIKEVEAILKDNYDNDYNNVLKIYPKIDTALANTYQEQIDDCIKKASIAIQRHKNSKWVDDSYIYIGRARHYSLEYVNAIETYKFVNTKSEDDDARHEALARLLRVFVDSKEFENAVAVEDYIKKETLNKKNQKLLHINKAHHYQVVENYDKMVENLVKAAPMLKKKDGKGRIYFIIGQIYQKLGFDAEAFNYYKKCLASNPEYELDFYCRLNMAQVTQLGKSSDVKAARKLLNTLLKDSKNKEYKDKIYYEMAQFEFKQNNLDKAIEYYKSSVENSISNPRQKGQSFLRLGEVYYDSIRNYELAQAYYDSAVQSLPPDYENIEKIKERKDILNEFVKQLNTIELQDSLLMLSELDTATLSAKLNTIIEEEKAKKQAEEERLKREQRRTRQFNNFNQNSGISSTAWYFGNPSAVAQGQAEFIRIWGNRPLEDNWRRSNKSSAQSYNETNLSDVVRPQDVVVNTDSIERVSSANKFDQMYAAIPFSEEARAESLSKIENAYYKLGNIYKFQLEEDLNAAGAFETLTNRFPKTEYLAEAWYQLYLIYKSFDDPRNETYKANILSKFPNSIYAKLIENPNYTEESTVANEKLKKVYEIAYKYYQQDKIDTSRYIIDQALNKYDEALFTANLQLLKVLLIGKTEDITLYQYELGEFITNYPDSELKPYAEKLLESSRSFQEKKRKRLGTQYVQYLEQWHYFVLAYEIKSNLSDPITNAINSFNTSSQFDGLKTSNLILNDEYALILVSDFEDKQEALSYYNSFLKQDPIKEPIRDSKFYKFVITKDNFNIFYQSKEIDTYLSFFTKNYLNGTN
ncbi:type IX secretion system periplasmic lipoprotein PorW/SprE [Fulvivirga lutea]|uniref:Tetratricopeptide repeat protein n=1 Tax=Fulvivirga lutea TaxID=2810512 RepID=A0A974WI57_9BACT|nr:tetratricopeptide repeat protein [Fulvivirga lutea]QSE98344.1 tetratricopeptide repeat protein [Fulvivirga lutea]